MAYSSSVPLRSASITLNEKHVTFTVEADELRATNLPEGALPEHHEEIKVGRSNDVLLAHVMRNVFVGRKGRLPGDGRLLQGDSYKRCAFGGEGGKRFCVTRI